MGKNFFIFIVAILCVAGIVYYFKTNTLPPTAPVVPTPSSGAPAELEAKDFLIKEAQNPLGKIITDAKGMVLYTYSLDSENKSACKDGCEGIWPPLTVTDTNQLKAEASLGALMAFSRQDGAFQVSLNGMPLYYYAGDKNPGETKGEGLEGKWQVAEPGAKPNNTQENSGIKMEEVAKHASSSDCWMAIGGKVYDLSSYQSTHPGGVQTIDPYCGKEASEPFLTQGGKGSHSQKALSDLAKYLKGDLAK